MGRFLDSESENLPANVILTDDPFRAKMLVAHHLDNAKQINDQRGMVGYSGHYREVQVSVFSVGFGEASILSYLQEIIQNGARKIFYIGECVSLRISLNAREVVVPISSCGSRGAFTADEILLRQVSSAANRMNIPVRFLSVLTDDLFWMRSKENKEVKEEVIDFAANTIDWFAKEKGVSAVSILTVSENLPLNEKIGDAERQSRFHNAAQLVFESVISSK